MAGIYLHIPFCKQACHYCNFHFSTSLRLKDDLIQALLNEIDLRKDYLQGQAIESIYFGGGTPSLLSTQEVQLIYDCINEYHEILPNAEITLEANPDDLSLEKLQSYKQTPINRFSIGIQSFFDEDLRYMNRAHQGQEALDSLLLAKQMGFENLTIDLIYGTPGMTNERWRSNLQQAFELGIPHISCYALTVEPQTALEALITKNKSANVEEEQAAQQFEILLDEMQKHGYEQYEISNFCKPGHYAKHNSNYWKGVHYLGLGPSAHSFNGSARQWNIAHNPKYIKALTQGELAMEEEILSTKDQYNEYILTSLRTKWGAEEEKLQAWGNQVWANFLEASQPFIQQQLLYKEAGYYRLSDEGKLLADHIMSNLFCD